MWSYFNPVLRHITKPYFGCAELGWHVAHACTRLLQNCPNNMATVQTATISLKTRCNHVYVTIHGL